MEVKVFVKTVKAQQGVWPSSDKLSNDGIEAEINLWLAAHPDIEIKKIMQSQSGGSWMPARVVISIWFDRKE